MFWARSRFFSFFSLRRFSLFQYFSNFKNWMNVVTARWRESDWRSLKFWLEICVRVHKIIFIFVLFSSSSSSPSVVHPFGVCVRAMLLGRISFLHFDLFHYRQHFECNAKKKTYWVLRGENETRKICIRETWKVIPFGTHTQLTHTYNIYVFHFWSRLYENMTEHLLYRDNVHWIENKHANDGGSNVRHYRNETRQKNTKHFYFFVEVHLYVFCDVDMNLCVCVCVGRAALNCM